MIIWLFDKNKYLQWQERTKERFSFPHHPLMTKINFILLKSTNNSLMRKQQKNQQTEPLQWNDKVNLLQSLYKSYMLHFRNTFHISACEYTYTSICYCYYNSPPYYIYFVNLYNIYLLVLIYTLHERRGKKVLFLFIWSSNGMFACVWCS